MRTITIRVAAPKPRNLLVPAVMRRKAGPHGKSRKAERRAAHVQLRVGAWP